MYVGTYIVSILILPPNEVGPYGVDFFIYYAREQAKYNIPRPCKKGTYGNKILRVR